MLLSKPGFMATFSLEMRLDSIVSVYAELYSKTLTQSLLLPVTLTGKDHYKVRWLEKSENLDYTKKTNIRWHLRGIYNFRSCKKDEINLRESLSLKKLIQLQYSVFCIISNWEAKLFYINRKALTEKNVRLIKECKKAVFIVSFTPNKLQ